VSFLVVEIKYRAKKLALLAEINFMRVLRGGRINSFPDVHSVIGVQE